MDYRVIILIALEAVLALFLLKKARAVSSASGYIWTVILLTVAFGIRLFVFDYETADYTDFLRVWVNFFRTKGGFSALKYSVGNYNIPYLYFIALFSHSSIRDLYLIKLLSVFFDIILAYSVSRIVGLISDHRDATGSALAFFTVLLWPTVFLNGALWGQCDSTYVSLAFLALWLLLSDRPYLSMATLALSFGFKLQAVFIIPVFAVFLFSGRLRLRHLLAFPVTYLLLVMPAVIAGRPFVETITLYFNQTGSIGEGLNYNSPSIFAFWDFSQNIYVEGASKTGIIISFSFMLVILIALYLNRKELTNLKILLACAVLSLGIPFLLPHMHDRYFYAADIAALTVALVYCEPLNGRVSAHSAAISLAALLVEFASLLGYGAYLLGRYIFFMRTGAAANFVALAILIYELFFHAPELISNRENVPA